MVRAKSTSKTKARAKSIRKKNGYGKKRSVKASVGADAVEIRLSDRLPVNSLATDLKEVHFYRSNEKPYGVFSNLYKRPFKFEGDEYPTAEHAYQAGKPAKENVRKWILSAPNPSLLAMAAHGLYSWDVVPDWANKKFDRMRRVLRSKFSQHPDLAKLLVDTGDARIVEAGRVANAVNRTWGEVNGKGLNMLGKMLMELRDELAQASSAPKKRKRLHKK